MKKGKDYYTNPFILYFFLFFPDWEKDFRSDSTFLPNNQVPLTRIEITPRADSRMFIWIRWDHAASILKGEIQVRISRIQASIEATSLNIRAYTTFPAPEKQFRANWGLCYRCPSSTSRMMRENIRSTIPAYWYVKLIDTCVIVIDPNFMIKFHRISLTNISIRY